MSATQCSQIKADGNQCGGKALANGLCMRHGGSSQAAPPAPASKKKAAAPAPKQAPKPAKEKPAAEAPKLAAKPKQKPAAKPPAPAPVETTQAPHWPDPPPTPLEKQAEQRSAIIHRLINLAGQFKAAGLMLQELSRSPELPLNWTTPSPKDILGETGYDSLNDHINDLADCAASVGDELNSITQHLFHTTV